MLTWLIERLFRTIEMIGILALVKKLLSKDYPAETDAFLYLCGWAVSYYAWSAVAEPLYAQSEAFAGGDARRQRGIWNALILVFSIPSVFLVHLIVTAIADVPFVS